MAGKPTYEELEQRVKELEKEAAQHKEAKKALRESEIEFCTLVERLPAITYCAAIDESSTTLYVSPQIEEILGISPDKYKVDSDFWVKHLHDEDRERVLREVSLAHKTSQPFISEYRMISTDGKIVWLRDEAVIVKDDEEIPLILQGIMFDITERKQAEEKIKAYSKNLERMVEERTKELELKTNKLEEINTALNVLLTKREEDKLLLQKQVLSNVKKLTMPYVEKMKKSKLNERQRVLIDIIESSQHEIVSPFSFKMTSDSFGLTPSELKVADLIRQGKGTKEVATIQNLSHKTVERHRENIRSKLGIKNKKINLQSHLNSLA